MSLLIGGMKVQESRMPLNSFTLRNNKISGVAPGFAGELAGGDLATRSPDEVNELP